MQPEDVSDTVSVYGHIRNRPEPQEPKGQEGVAQVLDPLFTYGSEHLDRLAFQQALDAIGAREHAGTDFSVQALAEHFDRGVELLADNELHPALPQPALEVIRNQTALSVARAQRQPGLSHPALPAHRALPADDPSLRKSTPETVRALTLGYRARLLLAGLPARSHDHRGDRQGHPAGCARHHRRSISATGAPAGRSRRSICRPRPPTRRDKRHGARRQPRAGQGGAGADARADAHRSRLTIALELGNAVLGGSFYSTRLSIDLRKNAGLVYSVESTLQAGRTRGVYIVDYASDPQNVDKAASMVAQELTTMQNTPVGGDELTRVKALLLRQIPLERVQRRRHRARLHRPARSRPAAR